MKTLTIAEYIRSLKPGTEMAITYSESNRVLAHRAAKKAGVEIRTFKRDTQLVIRLASERFLDSKEELGLTVAPIGTANNLAPGAPVTVSVEDVDAPFIWWSSKNQEPVPEEVLKALSKEALQQKIGSGAFIKAYNHPLINEGRNDSQYL